MDVNKCNWYKPTYLMILIRQFSSKHFHNFNKIFRFSAGVEDNLIERASSFFSNALSIYTFPRISYIRSLLSFILHRESVLLLYITSKNPDTRFLGHSNSHVQDWIRNTCCKSYRMPQVWRCIWRFLEVSEEDLSLQQKVLKRS